MNLGAHLSLGSEMQRTQSWWERLACNPLREVSSRLREQWSRCHMGNTGQSTALQITWSHAASCWQAPQRAPHCTAQNQRGFKIYRSFHFLRKLVGLGHPCGHNATPAAEVSWLAGSCFFLQCKLQQKLNQKFEFNSKVLKIQSNFDFSGSQITTPLGSTI